MTQKPTCCTDWSPIPGKCLSLGMPLSLQIHESLIFTLKFSALFPITITNIILIFQDYRLYFFLSLPSLVIQKYLSSTYHFISIHISASTDIH